MKKKEKHSDGESEENVYSEDVREDLVDSDEISPEEEGFMAGYDEAEEKEEEESGDEDKEKEEEI